MKIAYCGECKVAIAAGTLPETYRAEGKPKPHAYTHVAGGAVHTAKLYTVPETPQGPLETPGAWLARLVETHKAALA